MSNLIDDLAFKALHLQDEEMAKLRSERDSALRQRDEAMKELTEQRDQVDRWARLAVEMETQRDQAANACTGDLANMRARVEAVTAERDDLRREFELYRIGLVEWKHRAEAAESENTRLRAALEIAATDTSWEYVHKVAREALAGKYSEASDRGEVKESAEKDSEKYSVPALPIDHEAEARLERRIAERAGPLLKSALAKARAEALEECARIAENSADDCNCNVTPCDHDEHPVKTASAIAAAIRAAKGGEG